MCSKIHPADSGFDDTVECADPEEGRLQELGVDFTD